MPITITKKVSLGFLGDEYADSYITFRSIKVREFDAIQAKVKAFGDNEAKSFEYIKSEIADRFIAGEVAQDGKLQTISSDDLLDLPLDAFVTCYRAMIGNLDPKV